VSDRRRVASGAPLPTGRDVDASVRARTTMRMMELKPSGGSLRAGVGQRCAAGIPLAPLVRGVVQA
jgi:hypothetical protein